MTSPLNSISVLVLTFNEEANLPRCLDAISDFGEVVVVDSGSTDDTVKIAESFGAKVLVRPFDNFANQRNWGVENGEFSNEWILHLDADEVVTDAFKQELSKIMPDPEILAYRVPAKMMFFGRWLKYAGMWPAYQVRLGRLDELRFVQVGHGQREDLPSSAVGTFAEPYLHYSFSHGLQKWLEKHVRYAKDEAEHLVASSCIEIGAPTDQTSTDRRRRLKAAANKVPLALRPFARFLYVYFIRQGFRDGFPGFSYAFMLSVYEGMITILAWEKRKNIH